jgi:hypothetical protein
VAAPTFGAEGAGGRAPVTKAQEGRGAENAGPGHRVRGRRRRGRGVRGGPTPLVQGRYFGTEGATILDTWPLPTCKVGLRSGRKQGRPRVKAFRPYEDTLEACTTWGLTIIPL